MGLVPASCGLWPSARPPGLWRPSQLMAFVDFYFMLTIIAFTSVSVLGWQRWETGRSKCVI